MRQPPASRVPRPQQPRTAASGSSMVRVASELAQRMLVQIHQGLGAEQDRRLSRRCARATQLVADQDAGQIGRRRPRSALRRTIRAPVRRTDDAAGRRHPARAARRRSNHCRSVGPSCIMRPRMLCALSTANASPVMWVEKRTIRAVADFDPFAVRARAGRSRRSRAAHPAHRGSAFLPRASHRARRPHRGSTGRATIQARRSPQRTSRSPAPISVAPAGQLA